MFANTIRGREEIAVVYLRSGYVPSQYFGTKEWAGRLKIERSRAIKCPWIGLHLAGCKKIQQVLAKPGIVEKYLHDDIPSARLVRSTFAGLWGFDSSNQETTNELIGQITSNPEKFVLKPQLEGGGNNIYGASIPKFMQNLSPTELEAYIAMERIFPAQNRNYLVRPEAPVKAVDTVSELGIYGFLLGDIKAGKVIKNVADGHMLRTKATGIDEGGIMAGASALDSPFLIGK